MKHKSKERILYKKRVNKYFRLNPDNYATITDIKNFYTIKNDNGNFKRILEDPENKKTYLCKEMKRGKRYQKVYYSVAKEDSALKPYFKEYKKAMKKVIKNSPYRYYADIHDDKKENFYFLFGYYSCLAKSEIIALQIVSMDEKERGKILKIMGKKSIKEYYKYPLKRPFKYKE